VVVEGVGLGEGKLPRSPLGVPRQNLPREIVSGKSRPTKPPGRWIRSGSQLPIALAKPVMCLVAAAAIAGTLAVDVVAAGLRKP
jgi:hypothetical protein